MIKFGRVIQRHRKLLDEYTKGKVASLELPGLHKGVDAICQKIKKSNTLAEPDRFRHLVILHLFAVHPTGLDSQENHAEICPAQIQSQIIAFLCPFFNQFL